MEILTTRDKAAAYAGSVLKEGYTIGFVPTMGALHRGHLSLVECACRENDRVVVSIFVNPTQFNNPADLETYPRDKEQDLKILEDFPVDMVFIPPVEEVYPKEDTRSFDLSPLDRIMEGKHRPGHFNGVAQVVSKLFEIIRPTRAYFGKKDFQQVAVIRKLTRELGMEVEIIPCPIIREPDGLAMSSRNRLLSEKERNIAPEIAQTLRKAREKQDELSPTALKKWVTDTLNQHPEMQVEYFEIVDDQNLNPVESWDEQVNKVGCVAVQLGAVRLIDNIYFH